MDAPITNIQHLNFFETQQSRVSRLTALTDRLMTLFTRTCMYYLFRYVKNLGFLIFFGIFVAVYRK